MIEHKLLIIVISLITLYMNGFVVLLFTTTSWLLGAILLPVTLLFAAAWFIEARKMWKD